MCVCKYLEKRFKVSTNIKSFWSQCLLMWPFQPKAERVKNWLAGVKAHQTRGCSRKVTALLGHSIAPIPASHVPRVRSLMCSA